MNPDILPRILEFAMLFCFGFSWPFAIAKTVRAKRVDGKSPMFEIIVIVGYLFGIASHLISDRSWVTWVYLADTALVATDLALYFHYARRSRSVATFPAVARERDPPGGRDGARPSRRSRRSATLP